MNALFHFIEKSHSAYHATEQAIALLEKENFEKLEETKPFHIKKGGKYFVVRDSGSLIAFIVPQKGIDQTCVFLSHTDSPTFRIKPKGESQQENMVLWGLEVYGSPIYASWLNRDLGIAGRIFVEEKGKIKEELIHIDEHPVTITQLPIHIDRNVNTEGLKISAQEHLQALATLSEKKVENGEYLLSLLKKKKPFSKLLQHELYLCPIDPPRFLGSGNDLFSAPRIDNLLTAHACLKALIEVSEDSFKEVMPMIYLANHEEIGSRTYSGADSPFFKSVFERVFYQLGGDFETLQTCYAKSMALSLDGAHALDSKNKEKFEPTHTPILGKGIAIKIDTGSSYSYASALVAQMRSIANKNNLDTQNALKRGDARQGSTLGPMFVEKVGIPALDLGCPQLSMHSIREVASLRDYEQLVKLLVKVYKQ